MGNENQERLATQLRENLKRRKAQERELTERNRGAPELEVETSLDPRRKSEQ
jgi:hypothetical protein